MKNIKRLLLLDFIKITDVALLLLAFILAVKHAQQLESITEFINLRISIINFISLTFIVLSWHVFFKILGIYDSKRLLKFYHQMIIILKGVSLCAFSMFFINFFIPFDFVTLTFLNLFWIYGLMLLLLERVAMRIFQLYLRKQGKNLRYVLIAGTNIKAQKLAKQLLMHPDYGYKINGFIDENWEGSNNLHDNSPEIVSDFNTIQDYLRKNPIDEIFISLPVKTYYDKISLIVAAAEEQGILVRYTTDLFNLKLAQVKIEYFEGEPIMTFFTGHMYRKMILIKETSDFVLALTILICLLPAFLVIAMLIKLTSPGPVFFTQKRLGINKHLFKMIKFRTMVADAEQRLKDVEVLNDRKGEAAFKIKNDPRVTAIGKVLRKTSLDEIPQLINVLLGDMSMVGPRPLPVRDYEGFDRDWHRRRFSVKPGITCIWQVSGRDNISFNEWMKMDMDYIDKWSIWLDMKLLLKTIGVVILGVGAS